MKVEVVGNAISDIAVGGSGVVSGGADAGSAVGREVVEAKLPS